MNVIHQRAEDFIPTLEDNSVELLLTDPPYKGIVEHEWDNQWSSPLAYAEWLTGLFNMMWHKLTPNGSIVFFGGLGKPGDRPLLMTLMLLEQQNWYTYRNWVTWKKRRAYGKSHDYLYCREEILWFSKGRERTDVIFNVPYLEEKRGYAGFNEKYPAKSEYKRCSNVWDDIPELMRPRRDCEKPVPLMRRFVETHSNEGGLVVDIFSGSGATPVACTETGRRFAGCDTDVTAVEMSNERISQAKPILRPVQGDPVPHVLHKCDADNCFVCTGGLDHCEVCNGAEASLPTECPRIKMTSKQESDVQSGKLDFVKGKWSHTQNTQEEGTQ